MARFGGRLIAGVLALGVWGSPALAKVPSYLLALEGSWSTACDKLGQEGVDLYEFGLTDQGVFAICLELTDICDWFIRSEIKKYAGRKTIKYVYTDISGLDREVNYMHLYDNNSISFSKNQSVDKERPILYRCSDVDLGKYLKLRGY
jgi:hypothetical protein